jgi:xanthine dehydrogenase YagS FAD-binding subunit
VRPLSYTRATTLDEAIELVSSDPSTKFLAGGTTEVDLIRLGVEWPDHLVDINELPLTQIEELDNGAVRIGALARMSDAARSPVIQRKFPGVSQALLLGASEQLRNMASMGGNLCQRTRCAYFRDGISSCNKRQPGSGCAALEGFNRGHAILGTSAQCIATHPSDVAVALVAFDAVVKTIGPAGPRDVPIDEFFLLPGDTPHLEHPLSHGELIVGIELPALPVASRSIYLKFRDRQSYEFALVSVAAALRAEDGVVSEVRLALGGVATKPWRARAAETSLIGTTPDAGSFAAAAQAELANAEPRAHNGFKVVLARRALVRALTTITDHGGPR